MGAFATLYQKSRDPLLAKLCQLVMTDEAFHHKFGKIWADRTIPKLSAEEHNLVEDWAAQCFQTFMLQPRQFRADEGGLRRRRHRLAGRARRDHGSLHRCAIAARAHEAIRPTSSACW